MSRMTSTQRAAMTTLWNRHPQGAILRGVTARALERQGFATRLHGESPRRLFLSPYGVEWCKGQGW